MVKKFLAAVVVLLVMVSGAWADWMLFGNHSSIADITDGKSDYSDARFFRFSIELQEPDIQATEEFENISGSLTISGGNYSFWNGTKMQKVSNTPQTFRLEEVGGGNNSLRFVAKDNSGNIVYLLPEDETGLNGVNVSCDFPEMPSLNGQVNLGNFRTVQEQVNEFVPYVEYIRDGSKVTGLICRAVKGSDTSSAVSADSFGMNAWVNIWGQSWNWICSYGLENGKPNNWFDAGEAIEGTISFDEPVEESDIWAAEIWFCTFENGQRKDYDWYFFDNKPVPNVYLWRPHASKAELINGKSDYRNAEFVKVDMYIEAENILAEAKHLTDEGRINIPGGGYTIVSDDDVHSVSSKTVLGTVESGNNKTFGLRMRNGGLNASNAYIGTTWAEYEVTDDSGRSIAFAGGAETGLNGRTVTWTFPADLGFEGNNTLPDFKSTAEQLAGILPYAEIVSADGKVTAINYRLVTSNDTSTVQTPGYRTDFRIYIESWDEEAQQAVRLYRGSWQNDKTSGTIELSDENIPVSQVSNVQVRLRSREDSRRPVYIWHFLTAEAPAPLEITTATLPSAVVNTSYTATLAANIPSATWAVVSGTLPAGLTLSPSTGTISGTPTTANSYTFTVRATSGTQSAEKQLSITINAAQGTESGSSGGCNGLGVMAALALAFILSKKH